MNKNKALFTKNEKGSAIVETLPLLIIFMTILGNMWGFFMATHSGILSSIAARTYAFETFRNRSDLTYFRDQATDSGAPYDDDRSINYAKVGSRIHSIIRPGGEEKFYPLSINYNQFSPSQAKASASTKDQHNGVKIFSDERTGDGVKEIWIRSTYGICLNFKDCV